jgi:hypothetical protein
MTRAGLPKQGEKIGPSRMTQMMVESVNPKVDILIAVQSFDDYSRWSFFNYFQGLSLGIKLISFSIKQVFLLGIK